MWLSSATLVVPGPFGSTLRTKKKKERARVLFGLNCNSIAEVMASLQGQFGLIIVV